jgi:hypothetical protein
MGEKHKVKSFGAVLAIGVLFILSSGVSLPLLASAAAPALPPRPIPTPTLEPTLPPEPTDIPGVPPGSRPSKGAFIALHVPSAPEGVWTVVQWQDGLGNWQDVEGWQGTLEAEDEKVWWVASKDFNTGPFRWAVYQYKDGPLLAASASFDLPHAAGEVVAVRVTLAP